MHFIFLHGAGAPCLPGRAPLTIELFGVFALFKVVLKICLQSSLLHYPSRHTFYMDQVHPITTFFPFLSIFPSNNKCGLFWCVVYLIDNQQGDFYYSYKLATIRIPTLSLFLKACSFTNPVTYRIPISLIYSDSVTLRRLPS